MSRCPPSITRPRRGQRTRRVYLTRKNRTGRLINILRAATRIRPSKTPNTSFRSISRRRGRSTRFWSRMRRLVHRPDGYVMVLSTDQSSHTTLHECKSAATGSQQGRIKNLTNKAAASAGKGTWRPAPCPRSLPTMISRTVKGQTHAARIPAHHLSAAVLDGLYPETATKETASFRKSQGQVYSDTGAFALWAAGAPSVRVRRRQPQLSEFRIEGMTYYTNNPPAGARFRGFGVTQTCFATGTLLDENGR